MSFSTKDVKGEIYMSPSKRLEECVLTGITLPKDKNQKVYILFTFKHLPTGAVHKHSEFDPSVRQSNQTDIQFDNQNKASMQRFQHIMGAYMPVAETEIDANSWEEFIKKVGGKLSGKYNGVVCALKLVARGKYAAFPRYPEFISTEKYLSLFKWNKDYDKLESESEESTSSSIPNSSTASENPFEDDPFGDSSESSDTVDDFTDTQEEVGF